VSTTATPDRFTSLPDEHALAATVVALEEHGFSVEVVDDLDAVRAAVLARIPDGSSVMTNASVTLAGIVVMPGRALARPAVRARWSGDACLVNRARRSQPATQESGGRSCE